MIDIKKNYKKFKIKIFYCLLIVIFTSYLIINTGLFADDYSQSREWYNKSFLNFFNLSHENLGSKTLSRLPEYLIFYPIFFFLKPENFFLFDCFKILILLTSIYFIYFFGKEIFLGNKNKAIFFSLIIVFYPSHETVIYYYTQLPYSIFLPAFFFFTVALIIKNKYFYLSRFFFFLCSFFSYSSPPYILSAIFYFILKKKYKDALFSLFCLLSYVIYYFYLFSLDKLDSRVPSKFDFFIFLKNLLLQFISSIDANLGFSFLYKIILSFKEASFISFLLTIILFIIILKIKLFKNSLNKHLVIFFSLIFLTSLGMYAITGQYPQTPFNFANRVTIYFSPLIAYILTSYLHEFKSKLIILVIIIMPTFFLSDHIKKWNNQKKIIEKNINIKISNNSHLKSDQIFIDHFMYSKLGKINHLEYLITPWILKSIFKHDNVYSIHSRTSIKDNYFIDNKFFLKINLSESLFYYDLKNNNLYKVKLTDIKKLIQKTEIEIRHPIQLAMPEIVIKKFINYFPKYKYLFFK